MNGARRGRGAAGGLLTPIIAAIDLRRSKRCGLALALVAALAACAADTLLLERPGRHGAIIVSEAPGGLRTLRFAMDGTRQSVVRLGDPEHLELPYARVAMAGLALVARPQRVLVVGLGGGSIPMFLRARVPEAMIDVVEIDPDVIEVAARYFGVVADARLRVHLGDGRQFIERSPPAAYDLVILDAFGAHSVPRHLATLEFLRAVRAALRPDSVVVSNVWNRASNPLHDDMLATLRAAFAAIHVVDVHGDVSRIVLGLPRIDPMDGPELARRAAAVSVARGFRFDLGTLVEAGYAPVERDGAAGSVLHDRGAP